MSTIQQNRQLLFHTVRAVVAGGRVPMAPGRGSVRSREQQKKKRPVTPAADVHLD